MAVEHFNWRGWAITQTSETGRTECVKPCPGEPNDRLVVITANRTDPVRGLAVAKRDMLLEEARVAGGGIQRDRQGNPKRDDRNAIVIDYDPDLHAMALAQHDAIRSGQPDVA